MTTWLCVIAGGPDHGRLTLRPEPRVTNGPGEFTSSDGVVCLPVVVRFDGSFSNAIFKHVRATDAELSHAEAYLNAVVAEAKRITPEEPLVPAAPPLPLRPRKA